MATIDEMWLATQRRQLDEVKMLMERLEGGLRVAVRVPTSSIGQLTEARSLTESIGHEMRQLGDRLTTIIEGQIGNIGCTCPNPALHQELAGSKPIDPTKCVAPGSKV